MARIRLAAIALAAMTLAAPVSRATCPATGPTLVAPAGGATLASPVNFSWSGVPGAIAYRIWLGADGDAPAIVARSISTTTTGPVPSGAIDWFVEAIFKDCPSVFSGHGSFTVTRAASCSAQPATLVAPPAGTDVVSPVTFVWNGVPGAAGYRVWVGTGGDFDDEGFTTATQMNVSLGAGTYTWYVDTVYSGCPAVSSAQSVFRVPEPIAVCSGKAPSITGPANGATVASPVALSWTAVAGVKQYRVYGSLNGGPVQLLSSTTATSAKIPLPPGTIAWFVESAVPGCASSRSTPSRFNVPRASDCPAVKPQLIAPANDASDVTSPATFSWSAVPGAVRYVVVAKGQNGALTVIGDTTATQIEREVPAGKVVWFVVALGSGCDPVASQRSAFTVPLPDGCPVRRPHPLAPADDSVNAVSPVTFEWTKTPGATSYKLFAGVDGADPSLVATTSTTKVTAAIPSGAVRWYVEATSSACPALFSAVNDVTVAPSPSACASPDRPAAHVVAQVLSGSDYTVRWTGVANAAAYQLQESTSPSFAKAATQTLSGVSATFHHGGDTPTVYYYRVRTISSCSDDRSAFSKTVATRVVPPNTFATKSLGTVEVGTQAPVIQTLSVAGSPAPVTFAARTNRPWMSILPASGTIPPQGLTFTITSDPSVLNVGANQGAVVIDTTTTKTIGTNGTTSSTTPISVSLVTPVAPDTKASPPPDSLIIPAVVHGPGANGSLFESDIRVANVSSQAQSYLINFTPTGTNGTQTGTTTTIQIDPGSSAALNDLLASFFGTASDGSAAGMLEIRPLTTTSTSPLLSGIPSSALATVASSKTYNVTANGTFGQFIPAIPFRQFAGQGSVLSLQQISQSADNTAGYRTNFGLVEASGEPASVMVHVYDDAGNLVKDIPETLLPSEHLPLNGLLTLNGITLDDGRVEVEVLSPTGKVSAYASVVDNISNDPLLVSPVLKSSASTSRSVLPGVAYSNGIANWRSDVRLFNAGSSRVDATLSYYPQGAPGSPMTKTVSVDGGHVVALDNVLNTTFGISDPNAGGSLVVTTPAAASLITSARTYAATSKGTIGQFIPGVTPDGSAGLGDPSLQILQLESSASFRTNIGIAETTGSPVTVEISLNLPDSKVTPVITQPLAPNEFIQLPLAAFGVPDPLYNARVSVTVTDGTGKVTAYGSLIDKKSSDPTFVPAQ